MINGAFRGQRITGQQRFATELVQALHSTATESGFELHERRPPRWTDRSRLLVWAWLQTLGFTGRRAVLLSMTSRAPLLARRQVVVVHDTFVINHPEWYRPAYRLTHGLLLKWQLRTGRDFVTVSEPVAEELRRVRPGIEVTVVPNAPAAAFAAASEPDAGDPRSSGGFLVAVGTLDPRKNLPRLLEAYGTLPESVRVAHPLLLIGGAERSFPTSGRSALPLGAEHRGYVPDDELAGLYRRSLAVVFVSLDEGFGLPAVEALACGARLIASDIPVLRWVCEDMAEFVDPEDTASIAAALQDVITRGPDDPAARSARRRRTLERFDWADGARRLTGLLERVALRVDAR